MKKIVILFLSIAAIFSFTQCSNSSAQKLCDNAETRAKIISELMGNDTYMKQVMDSMQTKHAHAIVAASCAMMKSNGTAGTEMMNDMMDRCCDDSAMCKMMMGQTMEMCDKDKSKCKMMMGCMEEHPEGMKCMKEMGMCNMGDMKMEEKKEDHSEHLKK